MQIIVLIIIWISSLRALGMFQLIPSALQMNESLLKEYLNSTTVFQMYVVFISDYVTRPTFPTIDNTYALVLDSY